jgi:spore photoproduct lyase
MLNKTTENIDTYKIVSHVYAIKGRTNIIEAEKIRRRCGDLSIPFSWADKIPQSSENGELKLEQERGILVLIDRRSPFIEKFQHPKGVCYPFHKLTAHNSCNYWCEYCYLFMTFYMRPQSIHYVNYDQMFQEIDQFDQSKIADKFRVLNLGELGDPLATDDITQFSRIIIPYVAEKKNTKLLFLTKSANVDNLIDLDHKNRTILSWSVNCDLITEKLEHRTPPCEERIEAAGKAQKAGYEIRFRIDPLFWFDDWKEQYERVVESIATHTNPSLITLGTYRPSIGLINHIKSRFPKTNLKKLEDKLVMDAGKKRFSDQKRFELYNGLVAMIRDKIGEIPIALCKEPKRIWDDIGLDLKNVACNCIDFGA